MARIGGIRRKKVGIFTKSTKEKGKISHRAFLQGYEIGDRVVLKLEPAVQGGIYLPRFHGKVGTVMAKQGDCYLIKLMDGNSAKQVVVHPVHLKKA